MRYISLFVALMLMASAIVHPLFAQWEDTNESYGGNVNCFATKGENLFVGTTGGVIHSTDGGMNW